MENTPRKRVLILGGGFAGLTVAMEPISAPGVRWAIQAPKSCIGRESSCIELAGEEVLCKLQSYPL